MTAPGKRPALSIRLLPYAVAVTIAFLCVSEWFAYRSYQFVHTVRRYNTVNEVEIARLDAVLSEAARMAVATGAPEWEARYRRLAPRMQIVIRKLRSGGIDPMLAPLALSLQWANRQAAEMETHALALAHAKRLPEARRIMNGEAYRGVEQVIASDIRNLIDTKSRMMRRAQEAELTRVSLSLTGRLGILAIFVLSWIALSRRLNLSQAELHWEVEQHARTMVQLTESEASTRTIIEHASDAVIVVDNRGVVTVWNPQATAMFGWTAEEAIGRRVSDLIIPERLRQSHDAGFSRFLNSGTSAALSRTIEIPAMHRDGREFPVEMAISAIPLVTGGCRISAFLRDITERKQVHAEIERARDMALAAARARTEFLANMSHEIRTPLNGIIGMTGLLRETRLNGEQNEFVETIRASSDSLLAIVNDVLDFSKLIAGRVEFEEIDFDLTTITESVVNLFAEQAYSKGLELVFWIDDAAPCHLRGDPGRLRQVLVNLLGNAIKFTEQGEASLTVTPVAVTAAEARLRFEVADTGIGIAEDACERLFRPFAQADSSTGRKYGGTGLGLAISARLVEQMDGRIEVRSEPGRGSAFSFIARFARQSELVSAANRELAALEGMRVLIVDDNAASRQNLLRQTVSWRMSGDLASSGAEALALLRSRAASAPYQVAIVDSRMPGMDGFALARAVRADASISSTRLIMISTPGERSGSNSDVEIDAWLTKPIKRSHLLDRLMELAPIPAPGDGSSASSPEPPQAALDSQASDAARRPQNFRVLLAEDNIVNQKVTLHQLRKLGYEADAAANGREVLEALSRISYPLVLMDCQMPEMDGYQTAAEIRRREGPDRRIVIVAITAHALAGDREKCLTAGMDDYIGKPVRLQELAAVLAHWRPRLGETGEHAAPVCEGRIQGTGEV